MPRTRTVQQAFESEGGDSDEHVSEASDAEGEEFIVEKVVDVRINPKTHKKEYFLKWKNYADTENTWEPEDNCQSCADLIAEYEANRAKGAGSDSEGSMKGKKGKTAGIEDTPGSKRKGKEDSTLPEKTTKAVGFSRGLPADKILGATDSSGALYFLISWKGSDEVDLVPAKEANVKCPQVVIKFYEDRLTWITREENPQTGAQQRTVGEDNIENAPAI